MNLMLKLYILGREELDSRVREARGASAVEYGLLVAAIAAVIILVVFALGDNVNELFRGTCQNVHGAGSFGGQSC
jgi:pilus assembly protein Flp/PilA